MRLRQRLLGRPGHRSTVETRTRLQKFPCACCGRRTWIATGGPPRCSDCGTTGATAVVAAPTREAPPLDAATASARFPLAAPAHARRSLEPPSARGVRPWGLRRLEEAVAPSGPRADGWHYDPVRQVTVDAAGNPVVMAAPTANSVTSGDGEEGPSEDWTYDFCPDDLPGV